MCSYAFKALWQAVEARGEYCIVVLSIVVIVNLSTVPLFLKTIHIPHARTTVVSPYAVVVFSHCNEQYLNTEVRPLESKLD